jgi:hypothetical protein
MILRYPLLRADVTEYRALLMIVATHLYVLNHPPVEKKSQARYFFRSLFSRAANRFINE